jgi:AcrR family transcriptional regulator
MEEKKEKALEKAREYFHRYGYRKASLSQLIAEIGISKPTFYNYFKNKEELFFSVMLETYNEFHYQISMKEKSATNAMEKLESYVTTFSWFLDTYPIYRDLYRPANDLITKWLQSRYSKDFFFEGVETVRSILEQGAEEGIFSPELDIGKSALLVYYTIVSVLSTDPGIFRKANGPEYLIDTPTLVDLIAKGLLSRET